MQTASVDRATRFLIALVGTWGAACQSQSPPPLAEPTRMVSPETSSGERQAAVRALPPPSAVLELFTSEGCSSCPAADETLARLTDEAAERGARVFTLELHVDYWNDLGWVDRFSDRAYSQRQNAYARRLSEGQVYTPQLIVNGRRQLVGSNGTAARAAVAEALRAPAQATVAVTARAVAAGIEVSYRVAAPGPVDLQLAVADDAAETQVRAGENAHQRLRHRHVVRAFRTLRVAGESQGTWLSAWPAVGQHPATFVAAYATEPTTLQVLGADALSLSASEAG